MTAITALNVRLGMDASNFSAGADLARSEVNRVAAVMRQSVPPAEKYKQEIELLNRTFSETGRRSKEYANAVEFLAKKHGQSSPDIRNAGSAIDSFKTSMMGAIPGSHMLTTSLKGPAGAVLALSAAVAIATRGMSEAAARIDDTAKAAKTAGLAFGELVAIQMLAGETVNIDAAGINKYVRELSRKLAEARVNGGAFAETLKAAGTSATELATMNPADAWAKMTDIIAAIPNRAEQIRVATMAVGKGGGAMVEMFALGSGAIDEMRVEAERLGAILSDESVGAIETMNDRFGRSKMAVEGIWNSLLSQLAPTLTSIAQLAEDFFVHIRMSMEASHKLAPVFTVINYVISKMIDGFRTIIAVLNDTMQLLGSLPGLLSGGSLNNDFSETNRLLDEMDAKANGTATATQQAADAAEALAIEAERAAEAAAQQVQRYDDRVRQLQIESVALTGNTELASQMQLAAEGYTAEQIATITAMKQQNALIADRIKKEQEAAKASEADRKKASDWLRDQEKTFSEQVAEVNREFDIEVKSAMEAAAKYFDDQKKSDDKRREDVSAGPGAGMDAGSSELVKFMADQANAAIGAAVVPERPTPGEQEIADKTRELLIAQNAANVAQQEELKTQKDLLAEFRANKFMRFR